MTGEVRITRCPPGVAPGAGDLHEWASRRAVGRSGIFKSKAEREQQQTRPQSRSQYLDDAATQWLAQHDRRPKETKAERKQRLRVERFVREEREARAKRARRELRRRGVQI